MSNALIGVIQVSVLGAGSAGKADVPHQRSVMPFRKYTLPALTKQNYKTSLIE
jgi:hypothetical protein